MGTRSHNDAAPEEFSGAASWVIGEKWTAAFGGAFQPVRLEARLPIGREQNSQIAQPDHAIAIQIVGSCLIEISEPG